MTEPTAAMEEGERAIYLDEREKTTQRLRGRSGVVPPDRSSAARGTPAPILPKARHRDHDVDGGPSKQQPTMQSEIPDRSHCSP